MIFRTDPDKTAQDTGQDILRPHPPVRDTHVTRCMVSRSMSRVGGRDRHVTSPTAQRHTTYVGRRSHTTEADDVVTSTRRKANVKAYAAKAAPAPPMRPIALDFCPVHGIPWAKGTWGGWYCPTRVRGPWEKANRRGWCNEKPTDR